MARRRSRIGLGDPITTNRLLLWTCNSMVGIVAISISSLLHLQNRGPFADVRAAAALGIAGLAGAILLYLAFMPPRWYLRYLELRSSEVAEAGG
jgi:hypothetical protein